MKFYRLIGVALAAAIHVHRTSARRASQNRRPATRLRPRRSTLSTSVRLARLRCRAGLPTSRSTRQIRRSTTSPPRTAASGKPPTTARRSRPSSRTRASCRSATSRSRSPTPTSSGSAPANRTIVRARRGATVSTNRPTAARPTPTWVSAPRGTSIASSSTRATTTSCSWPRPAACGVRAAIAASTRRPTAAGRGSRCSRSTTTPARTTS